MAPIFPDTSSDYVGNLMDKYSSFKVISSLVTHDINNAIINLHAQVMLLEQGEMSCEEFKQNIAKIQSAVDLLQENKKSRFSFYKIFRQILASLDHEIVIRIPFEDFKIYGYATIIISAIYNIIQNAKEAYEKKHKNCRGLIIKLSLEENTLHIEDNSGGFPIDQINKGVSSKEGEGHGVFLKTMLIESEKFGMMMNITQIPDGTRVSLTFLEN